MMTESRLREELARFGAALYERGLAHSTAGNLSVRLDDGWLITPTNTCLGRIEPATLTKLAPDGRPISGVAPSKEWRLHRAVYAERSMAGAIAHLHSTYSVAVSCLEDIDPEDTLPALTPYCRMKLGTVPLIPYHAPGDERIAAAVCGLAARHSALLLANHGPIVWGPTLESAIAAIEELEESARLRLILSSHPVRPLTPEQLQELDRRYPRN